MEKEKKKGEEEWHSSSNKRSMMFQTTDEEADFLTWATAFPLGEAPLKDVFDNSYFKNNEHPELRILADSFFIDLPLIDGLSEEGKFIGDPYKLVLERFPWLEGKISWHSLAPYVFHRFAYSVRNKAFSLDYQDKIVLERARKAYGICRRVIEKAGSSKKSIERIDLEYERELKRSVPSFVYVLGTYYGLKCVENPELSEYAEALVYAWSERFNEVEDLAYSLIHGLVDRPREGPYSDIE